MKKKKSRGFLLYAFGSKELDYGKLAVCCALTIKSNLKYNNVTLVVDKGTDTWLKKSVPDEILKIAFDNVIVENKRITSGKRRHFDTPWVSFKAPFINQFRTNSYQYSPYDETIVLDTDYIVMNNNFDHIWGCQHDLLMNYTALDLHGKRMGVLSDRRLSKYGIPLYWATLVYFRKCDFSRVFFDLTEYIREEYNFFQFLYEFKAGFYRNDFSFSVASHILSGYVPHGIKQFPDEFILTSDQKDSIVEVVDHNKIIFLAHQPEESWKSTLVNIHDMNIHIMNKRELIRVSNEIIKLCMEKI